MIPRGDKKLADGGWLMAVTSELFVCPSDLWSQEPVTVQGIEVALASCLGVSGRNQFAEADGQDAVLFVNSPVTVNEIYDGTSNTLFVGERPSSDGRVFCGQWQGAGHRLWCSRRRTGRA